MTRAAVVLAAGMGTRMKSVKPKVMHAVAGRPILGHVVAALRCAGVERIVVVTAPGMADVRAYAEALGAATAVRTSSSAPVMPRSAPERRWPISTARC